MESLEGMLVDVGEFFAPTPFDLFDTLMGQYEASRRRLENMAAAVNADSCAGVLCYFVSANAPDKNITMPKTVEELFKIEPAISQLDADFWDRALRLTDVLDYMPQKRRDEWFEQIRNPCGKRDRYRDKWEVEPIPAFTAETVRATLEGLIAMRQQLLAERVDGIFKSLSRRHVTNSPKGFRERMIINRAISAFGYVESSTSGVINDLRCVIAKFMGRDEPKYGATDQVVKFCLGRAGQWVPVDGGALRIRIYAGVGTAHLEVHPDMAWRLNAILANLYPMQIPAEFREPPKRERKAKDFKLFNRPIPFAVLSVLSGMRPSHVMSGTDRHGEPVFTESKNTLQFGYEQIDPAAKKQAEAVLESLGGVREKTGKQNHIEIWRFAYEPAEIIGEILCSGVVPDAQSHQFFPTPESVATRAVDLAKEGATDSMMWLEPSAGTGNLADLMPKGRTLCIEISELHAQILRTKGHQVLAADFLKSPTDPKYDRVVMNPPFSAGRWQAHLEHAAKLVAPGGRLVAILPASAKDKPLLPGFSVTWSDTIANEFANTTVSVVIGCFNRMV